MGTSTLQLLTFFFFFIHSTCHKPISHMNSGQNQENQNRLTSRMSSFTHVANDRKLSTCDVFTRVRVWVSQEEYKQQHYRVGWLAAYQLFLTFSIAKDHYQPFILTTVCLFILACFLILRQQEEAETLKLSGDLTDSMVVCTFILK